MSEYAGQRITLKFFELEDAAELLRLELRNREAFERILATERGDDYYTLEQVTAKINRWIKGREEGQRYSFGIFLNEDGRLIGDTALFNIPLDGEHKWILGYALDQEHQGKGYMSEAVSLVLDFAFRVAGIKRVEAGAMPSNQGSVAVLRRAGFQELGLVQNHVKINGKWEDHLIFAIDAKPGE